ncbi:cation efflux protein [Dichotomocladium elegans]|nr:cation efflux protein [Dichotomocladium elegans]
MVAVAVIIRVAGKCVIRNRQCLWRYPVYYAGTEVWRRTHTTHRRRHEHNHVDLATTIEISGRRGVQITMLGLAANVGLTVVKGASGWMMNSAALLADAAHSLSDLLGDFVTLYTYKVSRRPPDIHYPYGYGKYETVGSLALSSLLIAGAVGIGVHSFELFQHAIDPIWVPDTSMGVAAAAATATTATTAPAMPISSAVPEAFESIASVNHDKAVVALNPNAAWFAAGSVIIKEWLYQKTLQVAKDERSEVLVANAWHHRIDSLSSGVVLFAIVGSYAGIPILDPLGGLVVAGMVLKSSLKMTVSSLRELTDCSIDAGELDKIRQAMDDIKTKESCLVDFHSLRGRKLGPFYHIDVVLKVDPHLSIQDADGLKQRIRSEVQRDCEHVQRMLMRLEI